MGRINFGYILRRLRHSRDETLEQVSEGTGLSVAMLSRVERGERLPSPESVEAIARHFDLPVDYLMSETIANRMLNRYGEESTSRAAEHLSREQVDLGLLAREPEEERDIEAGEKAAELPRSSRPRSRIYGGFEEMDIRRALGAHEQPRRPVPLEEETRGLIAPQAAGATGPSAPALAQETLGAISAQAAFRSASPRDRRREDTAGVDIDPATEQVLRTAREASHAAAVLVLRETPSLSREARLQLIDQIALLAGQAVEVLQILGSDTDSRVRAAARDALKRLSR